MYTFDSISGYFKTVTEREDQSVQEIVENKWKMLTFYLSKYLIRDSKRGGTS
jgi:hypothetical protein